MLEPRRLSLGRGANAGDRFARGSDPLIESDRLGASAFHLGELRRDQVAELAHPSGERRIGALDPAEKLGAIDKVIEAVRVQQQLGGVRRVALVDRHETGRERPQGPAQAGSSPGELCRGLLDSTASWASRSWPCASTMESSASRAAAAAASERATASCEALASISAPRLCACDSAEAILELSSSTLWAPVWAAGTASTAPAASASTPTRRQRPWRARVRLLSDAYGPFFTACGVS